MKMSDRDDKEAAGCGQLIAFICIAVGIGGVTSEWWGWIAFGALLFASVAIANLGES